MYGSGGYGRGQGGGSGVRHDAEHSDNPNAEQYCKLFIGGLSFETNDVKLQNHFEQWGEVIDCVVMRDPTTKRSRGFGFVTYKFARSVDDAQTNRPHNIDGRDVDSKRAMPKEENSAGNRADKENVMKMFIGGVRDDTSDEQVREAFEPFGSVVEVNLIRDKTTGKCKGFGFITFNDYDAVDKCILRKRHHLNGRSVEVRKAQAKGEVGSDPSSRSVRGGGRGARGGGRKDFSGSYQNGDGFNGRGRGFSGGGYGGGHGYGRGFNSYSGGGGDYVASSGGFGQANLGADYQQNYGGGALRNAGTYVGRSQGPYGGGDHGYDGVAGGGGYGRGAGGGAGGYGGGGVGYDGRSGYGTGGLSGAGGYGQGGGYGGGGGGYIPGNVGAGEYGSGGYGSRGGGYGKR